MLIWSLPIISLLFIPLFIEISINNINIDINIIILFSHCRLLYLFSFTLFSKSCRLSLFVFPFARLSTTNSVFIFPFFEIFFIISVCLTSCSPSWFLCTSVVVSFYIIIKLSLSSDKFILCSVTSILCPS